MASSLTGLPVAETWQVKEVSASFGITLAAEAGVLLSKASAEATFEGLTASGDQASDLDFLVAGAGFEPATSGL